MQSPRPRRISPSTGCAPAANLDPAAFPQHFGSSASAGVFQSSVFRGRQFRATATAAISSELCMLRSAPVSQPAHGHKSRLTDHVRVENPYFQYFCGEAVFRHELPFDRSSLTRCPNACSRPLKLCRRQCRRRDAQLRSTTSSRKCTVRSDSVKLHDMR